MKAESGKRKEKQSTIMKEEKSYRSAFALVFLTMVTKVAINSSASSFKDSSLSC